MMGDGPGMDEEACGIIDIMMDVSRRERPGKGAKEDMEAPSPRCRACFRHR